METRLTNIEIIEFLGSYEKESNTFILEEGKEKSELEKIAEARGMKIKGSRDLAIFKTIYAFADKPNSNGAILPKKELLHILPQIIGKPININHNRRFVVGHYIDYKYIQKDNKVISYGVFYKNHFKDEWTRAKELFKSKKLSSSFEIWSPDETREYVSKGKFRMHDMEISGGALIYEDKYNVPAFKGAKVLEMSKKQIPELVYASKYKESEIITSTGDYFKDSVKENLKKLNEEKTQKVEIVKKEAPKVEDNKEVKPTEKPILTQEELKQKVEPKKNEKKEEVKKIEPKIEDNKIKCSNCQHEWEIASQIEHRMGSEKCPKCFAIVDQTGKMIYPPQIIDFKVLCPACKIKNWLITAKKETELELKCLNCAKEYKVSFKTDKPKINDAISGLKFMYSGDVGCYQCGNRIHFTNPSNIKTQILKCNRCGLTFTFNIEESKRYKNIDNIEEMAKQKIEKSSEKGGNTMELKPNAKEGKATTPKDLGESKEVAIEEKVVEKVKVEEQLKAKETPEAKVEKPKAEETPKAEEAPTEEIIEIGSEEDIEIEDDDEKSEIEEAKRMTYQQKKNLPDNMFAVVVTVKNKKTGKVRKIRKYPINDEAHVRNALARLGQPKAQATLRKLGVSIDKVRAKILKRAKQLNMTTLLERYKQKAELDKKLAKLPKEVTNCVRKKIKAGLKSTDAVKSCWAEYKKASKIKKSNFEYILKDTEKEIRVEAKEIDKSAKMTYQQKKALPDNMYAVVVNVKNKKNGKIRKIRMFPINDKAHVRNALARLGQPKPQATLKRLGVSIDKVRAKILRRARQLKMTQLLKRYKSALNKIAKKYSELKKSTDERINFYKVNAKKIYERREELGTEYAENLSDTDIVNDDKFNLAKSEKENLLLKAKLETSSEDIVIGIKPKADNYYLNTRKEINKKAFPKKNK